MDRHHVIIIIMILITVMVANILFF